MPVISCAATNSRRIARQQADALFEQFGDDRGVDALNVAEVAVGDARQRCRRARRVLEETAPRSKNP